MRRSRSWLVVACVAVLTVASPRGHAATQAAVPDAGQSAVPPLDAQLARAEELRRLARAAQAERDLATAIAYLEDALALVVGAGDESREASTAAQLGAVYQQARDDAKATVHLLRARALLRGRGDRETLLQVYERLMYAMPMGPDKDALRVEALAAARDAARPELQCSLVHQWGDQLFNQGRLADAFTTLRDAQACFERTNNPSRAGRVLVSIGRVYRAHGRLPQALEQYTRALALQEQAHDEEAAVQSVNAIAVTFGMMGRSDESLARYREGLARARKTKNAAIEVAMLGNLGGAYQMAGRHAEAIETLEQVLASERSTNLRGVHTRQLALAYQHIGNLPRARELVEQAMALADTFDTRLYALNARARIRTAGHDFAGAFDDVQASLDLIEVMRKQTIASDFMKRGFSDAYQLTSSIGIDVLMRQDRHMEALELAERVRGRAFLDLLEARSAAAGAPPVVHRGPVVLGREQALDIRSAAEGVPATLGELRALARRLQSTFVIYWVDSDATFAWVVGVDGEVTATRLPLASKAVSTLVNAATGTGDDERGSAAGLLLSSRAARRPWRALHDALVAPIAHALPRTPGARLTIVPHGSLFNLPFAGLVDARGRYLIESYEVHYVPAAGVLRYTAAPDRAWTTPAALLVGDPGALPAGPAESALPPLPWAAREVDAVKATLGGRAVVLSGAQASHARVREQMAGRSLIHVASHAIIKRDEALASYLALRSDDGASPEQGRLTAEEVYGLSLDADLVVLSGCRTALGPIGGDGVIGFTRAFLFAGAASVVATTWDVPDRTTYEVMNAFYRRRARGLGKASALRGAQLEVIAALRRGLVEDGGRALPEAPQLWAGFALVGEP